MSAAVGSSLHNNPVMRALDYGLALASIGYGVYLMVFTAELKPGLFWAAAGLVGLALAIINPAQYVSGWVKKKFSRKH